MTLPEVWPATTSDSDASSRSKHVLTAIIPPEPFHMFNSMTQHLTASLVNSDVKNKRYLFG